MSSWYPERPDISPCTNSGCLALLSDIYYGLWIPNSPVVQTPPKHKAPDQRYTNIDKGAGDNVETAEEWLTKNFKTNMTTKVRIFPPLMATRLYFRFLDALMIRN